MFSCLFSIDTYVWKFFKMLCFKILLFFMFFFFNCHRFIPVSHTNYKMLQNPDPESKRIFWQPLCTCFFCLFVFVFFNVTRVQGSFLDLSALKIKTDDQHWPFKGARV